jgi:hypothetical protein
MSAFNNTMFQSIKDALSKGEGESSNTSYNEILKTTPGNTYTVRLLPYAKDPKNTFFHYYNHGWVSFASGQYVQALSPITFGERDPIAEERFRILRTGTEDEKEKVGAIKRLEKYLVNVYVIDDPSNPDNNGKVKMLRYGKQLHKIIMEAIEGEDAEEFGPRIFDLGPNGVSFKIKCENQGEYPTYVSSRFTTSGKLNISDTEQQKIYDSVYDLTKVFTLKSYDDLKQMLDDHFYVRTESTAVSNSYSDNAPIPSFSAKVEPKHVETSIDDEIDELLKDL